MGNKKKHMSKQLYPMNMNDFLTAILDENRTNIDIILGGIAGAIVRLAHEKNRSLKSSIVALVMGGMCAHYFTPLLQHWTGLDFIGSLAFFCGLIGMKVIDFIFDFLSWIDNNPERFLELLGKIPFIGSWFKK